MCSVIRPICITILYHNLLLFIDIFHIMDMILMLFPLFCMYDDYEGNDCRSQNLMEKSNVKTPYLRRSEASGKVILRSLTPEDGGSQKERAWWATGGPHLPQARLNPPGRAWAGCGCPAPLLAEPLRVLHPLGVKTQKISSQKSSTATAG